ncbi:MAG: hypothetical protein ABL996_06115 [Micropepsaceae bacterium]
MINPSHLIDQAGRLSASSRKGKPRQTDLRRAVSSAYYAVFHALAAAAADTFVGSSNRNAVSYSLLYRAFEHTQLKRICEAASRPTLPERYQRSLNVTSFSDAVQDFAATFVRLQKWRHLADYDPRERFDASEVQVAVTLAEDTLKNLDKIAGAERQLFLALLLFDVRSQ